MTDKSRPTVARPGEYGANPPGFSESAAWEPVGGGWRQLHGDFQKLGFSFEWHDFTTPRDLDWSRSFHPHSLEICLNLAGRGEVQSGNRTVCFTGSTAGFYAQGAGHLSGVRRGGERHQFMTIELSLPFLEQHAAFTGKGLNLRLGRLFANKARCATAISEATRLTSGQQQLVMNLKRPPVSAAARTMWYHGKALELAAELLYQPLSGEELFCQRYQRLSQERAKKVVAILKENLAEPPSLEAIGRKVGCSQFHLSRIFAQEMGKTISGCLRDLRLERAAELLRSGRMNVTEAALEVGYSSMSHFTVAFRETFGCCPGLYPLKPPPQNVRR